MGCTTSELLSTPEFQSVTSVEEQFCISSVNLDLFRKIIDEYVASSFQELSPTSIKRRYQDLYMTEQDFEQCFTGIYKLPANWKKVKEELPLYKSLMHRFHCNLGHPIEALYIFQILIAKCNDRMKVYK